jgi:hypothetical protein
VFCHGRLDFFEIETEAFGFDHQLFDFAAEQAGAFRGTGFGQLRDDGADADVDFDEAFSEQRGYDFVGGVGVDLEFGAEDTDGRERVAGAHLAGDGGFAGGVDDLLPDRCAGFES